MVFIILFFYEIETTRISVPCNTRYSDVTTYQFFGLKNTGKFVIGFSIEREDDRGCYADIKIDMRKYFDYEASGGEKFSHNIDCDFLTPFILDYIEDFSASSQINCKVSIEGEKIKRIKASIKGVVFNKSRKENIEIYIDEFFIKDWRFAIPKLKINFPKYLIRTSFTAVLQKDKIRDFIEYAMSSAFIRSINPEEIKVEEDKTYIKFNLKYYSSAREENVIKFLQNFFNISHSSK